jgi:hypothetical protein
MAKPWWQSLTINSAIATGLAVLAHPAVTAILPAKVATGIAVISAVLTTVGLRRAIPNPSNAR